MNTLPRRIAHLDMDAFYASVEQRDDPALPCVGQECGARFTVDTGQHPLCYQALNDPPCQDICITCLAIKTFLDGGVHEITRRTQKAGVMRDYRIVTSPVSNISGKVTAVIEMMEDITERLSLESQFLQAQKLESIGRLAGGVAHDYNNMLSVILGYAEMEKAKVNLSDPVYDDLQEILKASKRSAEITRQLLGFARKQTIAPKVLDLNETVESILKMLRHLIGEDIKLEISLGCPITNIMADTGQIEQVLMNMVVNSRDSISHGGRISIETADVVLMRSDPADILNAIRLSKATVRKMKQNLVWASVYNVLAIPVAAGVLYTSYGITLRPEFSALLMSASSIIVATNAVLLKRSEKELLSV